MRKMGVGGLDGSTDDSTDDSTLVYTAWPSFQVELIEAACLLGSCAVAIYSSVRRLVEWHGIKPSSWIQARINNTRLLYTSAPITKEKKDDDDDDDR